MVRVAILFDNFGPYHLARLTAAAGKCDLLAIEVARRSGEYGWVAPDRRAFQSECLFEGTSSKLHAGSVAPRMEAVFGRFKPDIVVVPGWASSAALCSVARCLNRRVPLVVMSESQANDERRAPGNEFIKRQIVGCFSAALVGGSPHADYIAQLGMPRERIFFGYDAVDNDYFRRNAERLKAESRKAQGLPERYFLASARFIEKKNLPRLLEAFAKYRGKAEKLKAETLKQEAWDLVLLGDGPLRPALNSQLSTLNLQHCVHLPGFKQYPELPAYYGLASALVHASTTEQWGLVVNEAMASGLPVLVSNRCGCAPDLVKDGVNGFTFDPFDVEQLARLMLKVSACQPFELSAFGAESQRIISEWGPERFASGLKAAVDCALAVGPKRASPLDRMLLRALLLR